MEDRYTTVQGYRTRYWDEGTGYPLVLVHGLGACAESWLFNVQELAQRYRVLVPDLIGFGRSDKPTDHGEVTLSRASRFLAGFLQTLGIHKAHLAGNSMGGMVSLQFAVDYPHMLNKLILVDPAGFGREVHISLRLQSLPILGEILASPTRWAVRTTLAIASYDRSFITDDLIEKFYEISRQPRMKEPYLTALRHGVTIRGVKPQILEPLQARLSTVTAPTLIIWGRQDRLLPISHLETAKKLLPHAQVHIFEDCGHIPQMEKPAEFNRVVMEFLG